MDLFNELGVMSIGTRMRMLSERMTKDAAYLYELYGVDLHPKWFPVYYVLSQGEEKTVTMIAKEIGHSHPSASRIIREMVKAGLLQEKRGKDDARQNIVSLSKKGKVITKKIKPQYLDVDNAINAALARTQHNLWKALEEWEYLLDQKSLIHRVLEQKKRRESLEVMIIPYEAKYRQAFSDLNEAWISTYFKIEEFDRVTLDDPESNILDKGGHIVFALLHEEPVGVCALIKMDDQDYDFELAKMAVSPKAQGKGIGWLLGKAVVKKAKALGATKLYLESNTKLKPAINLYQKLGFQKISGRSTPYERCNIQMELDLQN